MNKDSWDDAWMKELIENELRTLQLLRHACTPPFRWMLDETIKSLTDGLTEVVGPDYQPPAPFIWPPEEEPS